MKKILLVILLACGLMCQAQADVTCSGIIRNVNTYNSDNTDEKLYILLVGTTHYVSLATNIAKATALSAFAKGKVVTFHMYGANITNCSGGPSNNSWGNGTPINHYFSADM